MSLINLSIMLILILINYVSSECITSNKSTYIIPSAQLCIPKFESEYDGYLFGPCNTTLNCEKILKICRFALYRNDYCILNDSHLCAIQSSGNYSNYYLVECG